MSPYPSRGVMRPSFHLPVLPLAHAAATPPRSRPEDAERRLIDSHGRGIRDLRLSITDRCNFRCVYCMEPDVRFADRHSLLSVDEVLQLARACVRLGVRRIRLTGGEPTLHPELTSIIRCVAAIDGVEDVSMTTNGSLVTPATLDEWKGAGLRRLTFSLDAVTPEVVLAMTRSRTSADAVIRAITGTIVAGLGPVKVNAVVIRGRNETEVPKLARLARDLGFEMRFIEYMPLDSGRKWDPSLLVSADEIIARAAEAGELKPLARDDPHSTCEVYTFDDGARIGVIAPVTRPFCGACSRLRITADGKVRPCLFSLQEADLMPHLRGGATTSDRDIDQAILDAVWAKQAGHGITAPGFRQPDRPMSAIGG